LREIPRTGFDERNGSHGLEEVDRTSEARRCRPGTASRIEGRPLGALRAFWARFRSGHLLFAQFARSWPVGL